MEASNLRQKKYYQRIREPGQELSTLMSPSISSSSYNFENECEEPLSECGSSADSTMTVSTQYLAMLDKQIEDTENTGKGYHLQQDPNALVQDLLMYKSHYSKLLESYKSLENEHRHQMQLCSVGKIVPHSERKGIEHFLDAFALHVAKKKNKFNQTSSYQTITEGSSAYIAKKWKRHYHSLIDAIDILYKDYQLIYNISESEPDKFQRLRPFEQMEGKLLELALEFGISESNVYRVSEMGVKTSSAFLSDLVSQCRIYRGELDKQLAIKERVYYVLKKAKDQRAKLKVYVNTLRDELRYAMYKLKETQSAIALQQETSMSSKRDMDKTLSRKLDAKKEMYAMQQRVQELERILKEEETRRKKLHNKLQEMIGNIRVYCRVRPHQSCFLKISSDDKIIIPSDALPDKVTKSWGASMKCFIFDKVFGPTTSQTKVFDSVSELITSCVDGFNVCIMAYGQTGSGKTHTMMGTATDPGVNRRAIKELLRVCTDRKQWTYQMCLSMVEIYNEDVRDLLTVNSEKEKPMLNNVKIMTNQDDDIILKCLSEHVVKAEADIISYLELGTKNRKVGSTMMNIESSRSHLILLLKVNGVNNVHNTISKGTLTLCDLAGSENVSKSGATGERFTEATSINKSLTSLGRVFDSLRRRQKPPYRETKLTFLLKPTLGGDSKCLLLVNVRGEPENVDETLRALYFGQSAMQVAPEQSQHRTALSLDQRGGMKKSSIRQ